MDIQIIKKEDIDCVATLLTSYWEERGMGYSKRWTKEYLEGGHAREIKKDLTFVLRDNNKLIGVIALVIYEGDLAELRDFVVQREFRGRGYGKRLLNHAIEFCQNSSIRKITSLVFPEVKHMFESAGFTKEGYLKSHFKDGEDLVVVSRALQKLEAQTSLKNKLDDLSMLQDVETETAERLRMLRSKK